MAELAYLALCYYPWLLPWLLLVLYLYYYSTTASPILLSTTTTMVLLLCYTYSLLWGCQLHLLSIVLTRLSLLLLVYSLLSSMAGGYCSSLFVVPGCWLLCTPLISPLLSSPIVSWAYAFSNFCGCLTKFMAGWLLLSTTNGAGWPLLSTLYHSVIVYSTLLSLAGGYCSSLFVVAGCWLLCTSLLYPTISTPLILLLLLYSTLLSLLYYLYSSTATTLSTTTLLMRLSASVNHFCPPPLSFL
jgi:hypothetical protein